MARPLTLGLYNSYDADHFHEAMRRAVARAGPLADAFGFHLGLFGFPFEAFQTPQGPLGSPRDPGEVARALTATTSIGQGGGHLEALAAAGRLHLLPFPDGGFPPQLGVPVLATRRPEAAKRIDAAAVADLLARRPVLVVVGLGPRGVPKTVHRAAEHHLELTGRDVSLETATALGVLAGRLAEAMARPVPVRLTVDAVVLRGDKVLLVRRGRPPFAGAWALPGGFVDAGEAPEEAVLRELREEAGVTGRVRGLVGVFGRPGRDPRGSTVSLAYRVEVDAGAAPSGGDDAADAAFHVWTDLPPLAFDHGEIVAAARSAGV